MNCMCRRRECSLSATQCSRMNTAARAHVWRLFLAIFLSASSSNRTRIELIYVYYSASQHSGKIRSVDSFQPHQQSARASNTSVLSGLAEISQGPARWLLSLGIDLWRCSPLPRRMDVTPTESSRSYPARFAGQRRQLSQGTRLQNP